VRAARPGTIETFGQEAHVRAVQRIDDERVSPSHDPRIEDRAIGCLLGLAVGDTVGATLEFKTRDTYPPLTDMIGGGPFRLRPG